MSDDSQPEENEIGPERAGTPAAPTPPRSRGLSLRTKLITSLLLTSLLSVGIVTYLSYRGGNTALTAEAANKLNALASSKKQQVEWYLKNMRDTFGVLGEDVAVVSALQLLRDGFGQLGATPVPPEHRQALEAFYRSDILPKLASASSGIPVLEDLIPASDKAVELQWLYLAQNPNQDDRSKLVAHKENNAYTLAHSIYHEWFREVNKRFGFYDLMLIDGESGDVVYTVAKGIDLGSNLLTGSLSRSNLGQLYRDVLQQKQRGLVKMTDFAFYRPSGGTSASFIATPIYSNFKFLGVLVAQVSVDALNKFMTSGRTWRKEGLGETGEVLLVGADNLLRSDARLLLDAPDEHLRQLELSGVQSLVIDEIRAKQTSILIEPFNLERMRAEIARSGVGGLSKAGGTGIVEGERGKPILLSFADLDLPDVKWSVVAKLDEDEALQPQREFGRKVMLAASAIVLATTLLALWLASRFLRPVTALIEGIDRLRRGETQVSIENRSHDEFGTLTDAFNSMAADIRDRDKVIEGKSRAYEALLKRIFPDAVAERLKKGEGQFIDTFPQVSVVYAMVEGFTQTMEERDGVEAMALLNRVVDAFDASAENLGVEKVKTLGEHYLAVCGLAVPRLDHPHRAVDFARAMARELHLLNEAEGTSLSVRIGIHSGAVHAGLVGSRKFVYDVWGRTVKIAGRIAYEADLDSVRISSETYRLLNRPEEFGAGHLVATKTHGDLTTFELALGLPEASLRLGEHGDGGVAGEDEEAEIAEPPVPVEPRSAPRPLKPKQRTVAIEANTGRAPAPAKRQPPSGKALPLKAAAQPRVGSPAASQAAAPAPAPPQPTAKPTGKRQRDVGKVAALTRNGTNPRPAAAPPEVEAPAPEVQRKLAHRLVRRHRPDRT